tara:strand:+ start:1798 stop:2532 length:735 start_codon:yes stop_codon:yes gene_type:complete
MNIVAIIQARRGSTRLPDKIFLELKQKSVISHVVDRLLPSKKINKIVIATTKNKLDDKLELWAKENNIDIFRGDENDVLSRYYHSAVKFNADIIVRITADDPLKDYNIIDNAIQLLLDKKIDFVCNNNPVSFPEGLDVEVMTFRALKKCFLEASTDYQKEHVTQYIHQNKNKFNYFNIMNNENLSSLRWTLDTEEDYIFIKEIYDNLYEKNKIFLTDDILDFLNQNKKLLEINNKVNRSQQYRN